jgi:hypothetical protein
VEIYLFPFKKDIFSSVGLYIEALLLDALPLVIVAVRPFKIPGMHPFYGGS